jgi:hypothetical protein
MIKFVAAFETTHDLINEIDAFYFLALAFRTKYKIRHSINAPARQGNKIELRLMIIRIISDNKFSGFPACSGPGTGRLPRVPR